MLFLFNTKLMRKFKKNSMQVLIGHFQHDILNVKGIMLGAL